MIRGAAPIEILRIRETGWLIGVAEVTDDAYGTVIVQWQGADLATRGIYLYPEIARDFGMFQQDPAGWLQRYFRPNPLSTAGFYSLNAFTGGWQGATWPFVPTVLVKLYLPEDSTQKTAYVQGDAWVIAITDAKAFIRSLRRVLDPKASLKIDPALLVPGPGEFKELKL